MLETDFEIMERRLSWLYFGFLLLIWIGTAPPPRNLLSAENRSVASTALIKPVVYSLFFLVLMAIVPLRRIISSLFEMPASLLLFIFWAALSMSWAVSPASTFVRLAFTLIVVVILHVSLTCCQPELIFKRTLQALIVVVTLNYLYLGLFPEYGMHSPESGGAEELIGNWKGLHYHKNVAGPVAAITSLGLICYSMAKKKLFPLFLAIVPLIFLMNTQAKTAIMLFPVTLAMSFVISRMRIAGVVFFALAGFMLVAFSVLYFSSMEDFLLATVDDPTLTGRTFIWEGLLMYIQDHPVFGAGFGSFWAIGSEAPILNSNVHEWIKGEFQGHNGFLDTLVTVGIPGLFFALLFVVWTPLRVAVSHQEEKNNIKMFFLSLWIYGLFLNFVESALFQTSSLIWVFLLLGVLGLVKLHSQNSWEHQAERGLENAK
jgi:exopolysaccharide production protein ExoQ